ncbi:hypothetical protein Tco_0489545 [Tanacetum coccineum]
MDKELVEGNEVRAEGSKTRVEGSSKRAGEELEQESSKKQKLVEDKETSELQRPIEVVPDKEEVAIDAIPLATKPPSIVDYKIHKEGKKTCYQIIRADGSSKMYLVFSHMLKSFDREDLETLSSMEESIRLQRKAKESVKLMMEKLFGMELELMLLWSTIKAKTINGEVQLHALVDGKKINITESTVRRDLQLEDAEGVDCLPNSTIFEQLTLMGSKTIAWNEISSGGPRCQETIGDTIPRTRFENVSKHSNDSLLARGNTLQSDEDRKPKRKDTQVPQPSDPSENVKDEVVHKELGDSWVTCWRRPLLLLVGCVVIYVAASSLEAEQDSGAKKPWGDTNCLIRIENVSKLSNDSLLARGNTLRSDEDSLKLNELMELCTTLQNRVLDLEKTKTYQQNEIASLKRRVKKLEKKDRSRTHKLKRLYKVGLIAKVESSGDEEDLDDADNEMFNLNVLNGKEVFVAGQNENVVEEVVDAAQVSTTATTVTITTEEITLVQALKALKTSKPKVKGIIFQEPSTTTTIITISSQRSHDKEAALKLQAEFDEEERLTREKVEKEKEANIALIEEWDDIQAKIDDDPQLAERLQAQEQEELSDAEKATLFQQLLEKRRKHFAAKRAEEKRNKPSTKAQ